MKNPADLITENAKLKNKLDDMKAIYDNNCFSMAKESHDQKDELDCFYSYLNIGANYGSP